MSLRRKVLDALFWAGGTRLVGQVLTWATTIVVIRLLTPQDYGLLAMATVFLGFLLLLAEAGLGMALVQAPEVDDVRLRRIFAAVIVVNCTLFVLLLATAPLIARFFEEDRLIPIIWVLALQFVLGTFAVIPSALLARRLDFKRQSLITLAGSLCGSLSTLGLAIMGYGVWALVIGNVLTYTVRTVVLNVVSPFLKWPDFSLKGLRTLILFGGQVTAARVMWFVYSQADVLIAGKLLGKEMLGYYSVSMHLASLPVQRISSTISQVAFPAFALIQNQRDAVASHVLKGCRILGLIGFPVFFGISSIAPELVQMLLGSQWAPAIVPIQLLALIMPLRLIDHFLPSAVDGLGRADVTVKNLAWACVVMPPAFFFGSMWGLLGLSLASVIVFPAVFVVNLSRSLRVLGVDVSVVLKALSLPFASSACMYAAVLAAKPLIAKADSGLLALLTLVAVGILSYAVLLWGFNRRGALELIRLVKP